MFEKYSFTHFFITYFCFGCFLYHAEWHLIKRKLLRKEGLEDPDGWVYTSVKEILSSLSVSVLIFGAYILFWPAFYYKLIKYTIIKYISNE